MAPSVFLQVIFGSARLNAMNEKKSLRLDSSTIGKTIFKPHGEYDGNLVDGVVTAHVKGPINREMVVALSGKVGDFYRNIATDRRIGGITVFHESMMLTMDAIEAYRDLIVQELSLLPQGIVIAHVASPEVEASKLIPGIFARKVFEPLRVPYRFFDNLADAERWIREQIAK